MRKHVSGRMALAALTAGLLAPAAAQAQFGEGARHVGAHVGLSGVGSAPSIGVNGELAITKNIAIGGWADTWSYGETVGTAVGAYSWDIRYVAVAGTGAYHFPIESTPKLDPFLGLALGYFIVSSKATGFTGSYTGDASRIFLGGFGGARYFFNERVAGVARAGFGAAYLTVGVDLKL
jgi:hypothetical protein